MTHSTTNPPGANGMYTPAERARFAEIRRALQAAGLPRRETLDVAAAAHIAPLLKEARLYLATFRPRVCSVCGHVFFPAGRDGARCLDCTPRLIAHGIAPLPNGGD